MSDALTLIIGISYGAIVFAWGWACGRRSKPNGSWHKLILHDDGSDPRAEVRDSETGEVIFPAVKGPLKLIRGDKS
jgi:hypothetical protein